MPKELNLLLLSAGRRVALMECFRKDAAELNIALRILAADMAPDLSAACSLADGAFAVPSCKLPNYGSSILELCKREGVDFVVPTIDTELAILARLSDPLASQGTRAVISSEEVVSLARDKLKTAEVLAKSGIATPRSVVLDELNADDQSWDWPLLVKPRSGSSSIGVRLADRMEVSLLRNDPNLIAQERLGGMEHTVNMFFDAKGELKTVIPHLRIETRAGEVSKAETVRNKSLEDIGWRMASVLRGARGGLSFQTKERATGEPVVFELNARFGGGYPVAHRAGACFTRWLLEEAAGLPPTANNDWQSGVRMLRYDAAVFA